jgi:hypothetical protein
MDAEKLAREYAEEHADEVDNLLLCNVCDREDVRKLLEAAWLAGYRRCVDETMGDLA